MVVVDLIDHKHAVASTLQRHADDLLAITFFVIWGGVDQIQARIHRAMDGGDTTIDGDFAVGEITDAEEGGLESRAAEFAPWAERAAPGVRRGIPRRYFLSSMHRR